MPFVSIGTVSRIIVVSTTTRRRYDSQNKLKPAFRTCGGQRRYSLKAILRFCNQYQNVDATKHNRQTGYPRAITYA